MADTKKKIKENAKEDAIVQKNVDKLTKSISSTMKRNETESGLNRTKPLDELDERYETLKRENEEDQKVIDDPNASESDKQAAADRRAERNEEMERLAPQIQQREKAFPLRERVKRIFKKYGWTLQAVVLATGSRCCCPCCTKWA